MVLYIFPSELFILFPDFFPIFLSDQLNRQHTEKNPVSCVKKKFSYLEHR